MITRIRSTFAIACLFSGISFAGDPFCGKWKLNFSKSKLTGEQLEIEDLANNKLRFTSGTESDTITVDGTDQLLQRGGTMALTKLGPNSMGMVIKFNGQVVSSMVHSISNDGQVQTIEGTSTGADGTKADFKLEMRRVGSGSGWSGTWERTKLEANRPVQWEISLYGGDGLTFFVPARKETLSVKFDGKDYTPTGPRVLPGWTSSAKRIDQQTLELSEKFEGNMVSGSRCQVSPDGKTLTVTHERDGQPNPLVIVYEKM